MIFRLALNSAFTAALWTASLAATAAGAPKHVILIMMENHGTDTILGNKEDTPFLNALIAERGVRYATQYYGVTHPASPTTLPSLLATTWVSMMIAGLAPRSNALPRNSFPMPRRRRWQVTC